MSRPIARQCRAPGADVAPGEVLVATDIGDQVQGLLPCPAAPLVGGVLERRGLRVRYGPVPRCAEMSQSGDGAALFVTSALAYDGEATAIAAAANAVDGVAVAAARAAVEEWSAVIAPRRLISSSHPWCQGAQRAVERARQAVASGGPVYVVEWLAGAERVRADLEEAGAVFIADPAQAPDGATVVLPAHGVPPAIRDRAAERGLTVIDATCPLVASMHEQIRRFAERGDQVVIIGRVGHAVTAGAAAQAPGRTVVAETPAGAGGVAGADPRRMSYVLSPGLPVEDTAPTSAALRSRFPALRDPDPDTFCYAASDRAETIRAIAAGSDVVLVLGADSHPDTRMAAGLVRAAHAKAQVVSSPGDIMASWLAGVSAIGLVETISTGAALGAAVAHALSGIGPLSVTHRSVTTQVARHRGQAAPAPA